jgi:AcrR family transcriptional regulator
MTITGKPASMPKGRSSEPPEAPGSSGSSPGSSPSSSGAPRKRTRLRKEEIVAEATRLFAERGYEGASMGDLAERVGLRKASLFHHFPSKDVLYAQVLGELMENVKVATLSAATAEGSFEERLDLMTDALTTTLGAQPHAARLLVREALDWGPVMKERLARIINDILAASLEFTKAGQREGVFKADTDATQLIVSMIGVHFMPFAIGEIVERFTGTSPFHASFVADRKLAVRRQVQDLLLARPPQR